MKPLGQDFEQTGVRLALCVPGEVLVQLRTHQLRGAISVLLRVPEHEDSILAVGLIAENGDALAARLR